MHHVLRVPLYFSFLFWGWIPTPKAEGQTCYTIADSDKITSSDQLVSVDVEAGTSFSIGPLGTLDVEAATFAPDGNLYAANGGQLGRVDLATGVFTALPAPAGTALGAAGPVVLDDIDGLGCDPINGACYGAHRTHGAATPDLLFEIDFLTGAHVDNAFGPGIDYVLIPVLAGLESIDDLAFDPLDGTLYAISNDDPTGFGDRLVSIDKPTGAVTDVGPTGFADLEGLAFHADGALYATSGENASFLARDRLFRIDTATGAATLVSQLLDLFTDYESFACQPGDPRFTLGDRAWYDTDRDGIQDGGEPGVANIEVELFDNASCTPPSFASTTTTSDGHYLFTGLESGAYCLRFPSLPSFWDLSPPDQGGDDALDSDVDPASGEITGLLLGPSDLDEDLGLFVRGSIGDTVWCDAANGNESFEPGEGVAGVTVYLFADTDCDTRADGGFLQVAETAGDGQYLFDDLPVGPPGDPLCYVAAVETLDPDLGACDVLFTPERFAVALDANEPDDLDADFGFDEEPLFTLGDRVWFDADQDGIQDLGEGGVPEIRVILFDGVDCGENEVATTLTDAAGHYSFPDLGAGSYCLEFSNIPEGWSISLPDQGGDDGRDSDPDPDTLRITDLLLGPNDFDEDLGISVRGSIGDTVWCDAGPGPGANNAVFDPGEGIPGVSVSLFADPDCDGAADDVADAVAETAGDGQYLFENLQVGPPGGAFCYLVAVDTADPELLGCDVPFTPELIEVSLGADEPDFPEADFGFSNQVLLRLGDRVWFDADRDGVQDPAELGLSDIELTLYGDGSCTGMPLALTTTNATGFYGFPGLTAGVYCLELTDLPDSFLPSPVDQGGDDTRDSDADPATLRITDILLEADDLDEDAGLYLPGSIGDTVWCDGVDGNAVFEVGEGVPGVSVALFEDSDCDAQPEGPAIQVRETMGDGQYLFEDLPTGPPKEPICYVVEVEALDPDLGSCNLPITQESFAVALDLDVPDHLDADFGFEEIPAEPMDLGDAPDSFGTTLAADGARHLLVEGFLLGVLADFDPDGRPGDTATGDDAAGSDDEDGVLFQGGAAQASLCSQGNVLIAVVRNSAGLDAAYLDAWIDFDGDGVFDHPGEHLFESVSRKLAPGANQVLYRIPCGAKSGPTYARFRLSSSGGLGARGAADDGEVEDYRFEILASDFGDAPESYGATARGGGPSHRIVEGYALGVEVDADLSGIPSENADADDRNGVDDDDGVVISGDPPVVVSCRPLSLEVTLTNTAGLEARLDAWLDFDRNGLFDHPREHLFEGTSPALVPGVNPLEVDVPSTAVPGPSFARFRLSPIGGLAPGNLPSDPLQPGEVEDYALFIEPNDGSHCPIFADDFESGTTSAWSFTVPSGEP